MIRLVPDRRLDPPDVAAFVDRLNRTADRAPAPLAAWFDTGGPVFVARAPGRLDVLGGIADYSGSTVLELPIAQSACAAVQRCTRPLLDIVSLDAAGGPPRRAALSRDRLETGLDAGYDQARAAMARDVTSHWAAYMAGPVLVLLREKAVRLTGGLRIVIGSAVPEGKGLSSSAALEVATMLAVAALLEIELAPTELARLCQLAENLVVGAPCGIMDQITVACGRAGHLLELLCQPAQVRGHIGIPDGVCFWGIDSGIRHAVSGADYGSVRVGAFIGYRMIAAQAGLAAAPGPGAAVQIEDPHWRGYLANLTPSQFEWRYARALPETIEGAAFLRRYGGTTDPVTRVDPDRVYAVRASASHPIHEHFRVRCFAALLSGSIDEKTLDLLGELMYQSHASYSACGLGSEGTDQLVGLAAAEGPGAGLYGAKITGGGCGGTVAVLGRPDAEPAIQRVVEKYARLSGRAPAVFRGSSPGAASVGAFRLSPQAT